MDGIGFTDVSALSNEDKKRWTEIGAAAENVFLKRAWESGLSAMKNPLKSEDPYSHDLFLTVPADLKTTRTRFYTAGDLYGVDPFYAVTLNEKDLSRYYKKYPHIIIIYDIDYGDYQFIGYANIPMIDFMYEKGLMHRHEYLDRRLDEQGNAKVSYLFDSRLLRPL